MIKRTAISFFFMILIPAVAYGVAMMVRSDPDVFYSTAEAPCPLPYCLSENLVIGLAKSALWVSLASLGLVGFYILMAVICGRNRQLNAMVFPKIVPVATALIALLILANAGLLVWAYWVFQSYMLSSVSWVIVGAIVIGAYMGAFRLIWSLFNLDALEPYYQPAELVTREGQPKVWALVTEIAEKIGAKTPDNVIVGLEPNFFAIGAPVRLNESQVIEGETLYLSATAMRAFTREELTGVIGHELGHFKGEDLAYSERFMPVYRGLQRALYGLAEEQEDDEGDYALMPAFAMLGLMLDVFSLNDRAIERVREFAADDAGAAAASPEVMPLSLAKLSIHAEAWSKVNDEAVKRLADGVLAGNLADLYEDIATAEAQKRSLKELRKMALDHRVEHPLDTHPSNAKRMKHLKVGPEIFTVESLTRFGAASDELFFDLDELERHLSAQMYRSLRESGAVECYKDMALDERLSKAGNAQETSAAPVSNQREQRRSSKSTSAPAPTPQKSFMDHFYDLASAAVTTAGRINSHAFHTAEELGAELISGFDGYAFGERVRAFNELDDLRGTLAAMADALEHDERRAIYNYLVSVAAADGDLTDADSAFLESARSAWDIVETPPDEAADPHPAA